MRKDAKIGFAIGGVLLAVLTVYVVVVPQHKKSTQAVTLVVPPGATDTPTAPVVSVPPTPAPETASTAKPDADKSAPAPQKVASSDGVNWESILGGKTEAPTIKSSTPAPSDPAAPAIADAAQATPSVTDISMSAITPLQAPGSSPAPAAAIKQPTGARTYTIKSGETLSTIAAAVYGNSRFYVAIKRANPNLDPNRLKPGMQITLPDISDVKPDSARLARGTSPAATGGKTYKVQSGDTLYRISKSLYGTGRNAQAIYNLNKDLIGPDKSKLKLGMVLRLPTTPSVATAR
jgi:nucleoid-associated protein YgaU